MSNSIEHTQITTIKPRLFELIDGLSEEQCIILFRKLQSVVPKEQRKHPRVACSVPVDYATPGGNGSFAGFVKDISKGGVFIETRAHLDIGEKIKMTFSSPNQPKPIKVSGRVFRKNTLGVGVQFERAKKETGESTMMDRRRNIGKISEEKRVDTRVDIRCPVYIEGISDEKTITDFSIGGVFVECDAKSRNKFRIGQLILLQMKLPTEDNLVSVKAQVVNYSDQGMHCQFAHLGRKIEYAIYRFFNLAKHAIPIK
jgi:Tfp pilus assembly protein PilZ